MQELRLKKNEDRRIRMGHLWIFSNEVDTKATPLKEFEPGQSAWITDWRGKPLAVGYVNPVSLISCRILSRNPGQDLNVAFFQSRLSQALDLRRRIRKTPFYRLVHGEGDLLPGLVIDRFGDIFSIQANTAGMDRFLPLILESLNRLLSPRGILLKNDSQARHLEGLDQAVSTIGSVPEEVMVEEEGARFITSLSSGQKTGFYYDMSDMRIRSAAWAGAGQVLDVFSYVGVFGVRAALAGAKHVTCVDSSRNALDYALENARINKVADRMEVQCGDAFELLSDLRPKSYDLVSVDPPAFIKRRKDQTQGTRAYLRINALAAKLVKDERFMLTASCSQHFPTSDLRRAALSGAKKSNRIPQLLWRGAQSPDHPVHPAMEETAYLKGFFLRLLSG